MENGFLGSLQMDTRAKGGGGGTSMFGPLRGMCRSASGSAWYRFMGSLKKSFQLHYLAS